jgi:hypothetical protein
MPGRKTDQKDARISDMLQHGLYAAVLFRRVCAQLCDLIPTERRPTEECNRIASRIQNEVKDANIDLASVTTGARSAGNRSPRGFRATIGRRRAWRGKRV